MAVALSIAMIMSNMTVYAAESGQVVTEEEYVETASEDDEAEDVEVKESTDSDEVMESKESTDSDETEEALLDDDSAEAEITEDDAMSQENVKGVSVSDDEETEEADEDTEESEAVEKSDRDAVDNRAATVSIPVEWDFKGDNGVKDLSECNGLTTDGGYMFSPSESSGDYLSIGGTNQSININVGEPCNITIEYHKSYILAEIGVGDDTIALDSSGSTTYKYRGDGEATVTIKNTDSGNRAYISKITISESSVGSGVEVALSGSGLSLHNLSGIELIFTDSEDANKSKTYYVGDEIVPGSGTYTVELGKNNSYFQGVTLSLNGAVDGKLTGIKAGSTVTINYSGDDASQNTKEWDLESYVGDADNKLTDTSSSNTVSRWYKGLKLDKVYKNNNYLAVANGGSIKIPVTKPSIVTATYYGGWTGGSLQGVAFNSTGIVTYWYEKSEEGYVELTSKGNCALTKITITEVVSLPTEWDFTTGDIKNLSECLGLTTSKGVELRTGANNDVYIPGSGGSMSMNVPSNCNITVVCHNSANATIGVGSDVEKMELSEGTQSFIYKYRGDKAETITINATGVTYINKIEIEEILSEWDFTKLSPNIEGKEEHFKGLVIDATKGKFAGPTNNWAQANAGTIIKVPVDGPSYVTVKCMGNGGKTEILTVDGVKNKVTGQNEIFTCKDEDKDGYATIEMLASDYIQYIKVEPIEEEDTSEIEKDFTIDFYDDIANKGKSGQTVKSEIAGLTFTGFKYTESGNNHGAVLSGGKMKLNLKQKASIIVTGCMFGSKGVTADTGDVVPLLPVSINSDSGAPQYLIRADQGTVTLTFTASWIHKIELKYVDKEEYVMTVDSDENGTASADKQIVTVGDKVTLTAEEKDYSFQFKEWVLESEGEFSLSDEDKVKNPLEVTMPAEDVKIKAAFEESGRDKPTIEESFTLDFYAKASYSRRSCEIRY